MPNDVRLFQEAQPVQIIDRQILTNLGCPKSLIPLIEELKIPTLIQDYIKKNLTYEHEDNYRAIIDVVKDKKADCFQGTIGFAYPLLYLWGYCPKIVMLQADNKRDVDHNLAVYRIKDKLGAIAMSNFPLLTERPAVFDSLYELAESYYPHYWTDWPNYYGQLTMVGFCQPIDLIKKYGTGWFFQKGKTCLKYVYDTYTEGLVCTDIFTKRKYAYPEE